MHGTRKTNPPPPPSKPRYNGSYAAACMQTCFTTTLGETKPKGRLSQRHRSALEARLSRPAWVIQLARTPGPPGLVLSELEWR